MSSGLIATQMLTSVPARRACAAADDAERHVEAEREPAAGGGGADDEVAAGELRGFAADGLLS